jgi:hypothetical protein
MKKTTLKFRSALLILITVIFCQLANAQTVQNFTLSPQALCYTTGTNSALAGLTASASGATGYQWSATGNCTPTIVNNTGTTTQLIFPCCGLYTITNTAYSGTVQLSAVSKTIAVYCTNFLSISNPTSLTMCAGSSKTINATGATSYTWSNNSTFASIVVSPSVNTCYTVTGTNSAGCTASAVACVTVSQGVNVTGNTNICAGNSTTLTASGSSNYTWFPGNSTGSVLVVSPSVSTCYHAFGTSTTACNNSDSICVNIQSTPNISISGNSVVCSGYVGMTASGATTYTWMPGNLTGNSIYVNMTSNTCYTVISASPGCGTTSAIKCVTVTPSPTLTISGNGAVCPGGTATLTVSGANTYSWTSPVNSTLATVVINPTTATCFSVMGTNSLGCTAWSGTCVTVGGPSITISGPNAVCAGGTATLSGSGGLSYTWSPGPSAGGQIVISPTTTTCYSLSGSNGTCTGMAVKCVSVVSAPVISSTISANPVCAGSPVIFQASGATSYTWLPLNVNGSSVIATPTTSGCYTVLGSNVQGCSGSALNCFTVLPSPTIAISGPSVMCSGNSATLTGSGATSYTWKPSLNTTTAIVVTPTTSTCYTLVGSSNGCSVAAVKCLTVQPATISVAGSVTLCAGKSATLTAFGSSNYTWLPGNQTTSVIVVSPTVNTCYTVMSTVNSCTAMGVKCLSVIPLPVISAVASASVACAGSSTTLTASGANTYTWQPFNQSGFSIVVSPTTNVCYTVSGNAQGCIGTATGCMSVQPLPVISVSGNSLVCAGSSATLTASGAASYTWFPGNMTGSATVITPTASSCYTVTGTGTNGCDNSTIKCITVQPTSIAISGNAYVCQGSSAVITASGSANYTWFPGGTTGASVTISPTVATCYTVLGTSNGCSTSGVKCVTIQANPVITTAISNSVYCSGYSYLFTASEASTYTWYPFNVTGAQISHTATSSMCYTVSGTSNAGCVGSTNGCFTVNPTPTLSITGPTAAICTGASATLVASGGSTYTWMPGNQTGAGTVVTPSASTCYTVIGTTNGCSSQAV